MLPLPIKATMPRTHSNKAQNNDNHNHTLILISHPLRPQILFLSSLLSLSLSIYKTKTLLSSSSHHHNNNPPIPSPSKFLIWVSHRAPKSLPFGRFAWWVAEKRKRIRSQEKKEKGEILAFWVGLKKTLYWGCWSIADITAIQRVPRPLTHARCVRRKGCVTESSNPSPHGGRGALPSEGGSPSDLLFLAGGGSLLF